MVGKVRVAQFQKIRAHGGWRMTDGRWGAGGAQSGSTSHHVLERVELVSIAGCLESHLVSVQARRWLFALSPPVVGSALHA